MIPGLDNACRQTGFVVSHAGPCQEVANNLNAIILFREPGKMAEGLISEKYGMKGFRIDTKSCDWGPMSGFVCADPRLTKDAKYEQKNANWTEEAVTGHIVEKFFGSVDDPEWVADVMPIVISQNRIDYLKSEGKINPQPDGADLVGESTGTKGQGTINWRLVPVSNATNWWLKNAGGYYVLCVNNRATTPFKQRRPSTLPDPILFRGHETVLGLINPGTKERGFKACVTADYDLFAIFPKAGGADAMAAKHNANAAILAKTGGAASSMAAGVARMPGIDDRLQSQGNREHHRFGDVSARVMMVKTALNTALIGCGALEGGNAIHHNDEAGNFALAKGSLQECLPLIAFYPSDGTFLINQLGDFKQLVEKAQAGGFAVNLKKDWLQELGL